ncbi:MAG: hypothetical protein OK422_00165 [Thaumarchaeota archaeon]|nr:hypothetical protein [Nitrososphaerota archaeon]
MTASAQVLPPKQAAALYLTVLIVPLAIGYVAMMYGFVADVFRWFLLVHIGSLLGFMLSHGAPAIVSLRLSSTTLETTRLYVNLARDRLVVLSMGATLGLVLSTGISMGFFGGYWSRGWIWATLASAIIITFSMSFLGRSQFDRTLKSLGEGTPLEPGMFRLAAAIGLIGLFLILWLALFKPF